MTEPTRRLLDLGRAYIETHPEPGGVCGFAGGSVGRGEADEFSDLDLNLYVEAVCDSTSENVVFRDEIIQVHVHPFPRREQVEEDPWNHRFLVESRVIWDPAGRFASFLQTAIQYLRSPIGRSRALAASTDTVESRIARAQVAVTERELCVAGMAGMAGMAAWVDAALMRGYILHDRVCTAEPLSSLQDLDDLRAAITRAWPLDVGCNESAAAERLGALAGSGRFRGAAARGRGVGRDDSVLGCSSGPRPQYIESELAETIAGGPAGVIRTFWRRGEPTCLTGLPSAGPIARSPLAAACGCLPCIGRWTWTARSLGRQCLVII